MISDQKVFDFSKKIFGHNSKFPILPVDMKKPFYHVYFPYWMYFLLTFLVSTLTWGYLAASPLLLAIIFEKSENYYLATPFIIGYIILFILGNLERYFYVRIIAAVKNDLNYSAYKFFMISDPINHISRNTGSLITKIQRAVTVIEDVSSTVVFEIVPTLAQIIVVAVTLFSFDKSIGLISTIMLVGIILITIFSYTYSVKVYIPQMIKSENKLAGVSVEYLQQIYLVRSAFAMPESLGRLKKMSSKFAEVLATAWTGLELAKVLPKLLFILSLWWVFESIIDLVVLEEISSTVGLALVATYLSTFSLVVNVGRRIEKLISGVVKARDLFDYAKTFGDSTFPTN